MHGVAHDRREIGKDTEDMDRVNVGWLSLLWERIEYDKIPKVDWELSLLWKE